MNEIVHINFDIDPATLSIAERKELLQQLDDAVAQHLIYKGRILASLAKDGVRIAQDFHYIVLQRVGDGSVIPELYISFQHRPSLMLKLGMLPIAEQRRLVEQDGPVEVVEMTPQGPTTRLLPVRELEHGQIRQVFDGCRIRTPEMQVRWIKRQEAKKRDIESNPLVVLHRNRVVINHVAFTKKQLQELIAKL